jgi:hypothetical protein
LPIFVNQNFSFLIIFYKKGKMGISSFNQRLDQRRLHSGRILSHIPKVKGLILAKDTGAQREKKAKREYNRGQ